MVKQCLILKKPLTGVNWLRAFVLTDGASMVARAGLTLDSRQFDSGWLHRLLRSSGRVVHCMRL